MRVRSFERWLAALLMPLFSVGLVMLSVWLYTTLRRPYLIFHPTAVAVTGAAPLTVSKEKMAAYGVLSAAHALDGDGIPNGFVVVAARQGYKSVIRVQCTFTADGGILAAMRVVSQNETEYLGERVASESFAAPFAGRLLPVKLWTDAAVGSPVDGLTGSTISAQAVVDAVNNAHRFIQDYLAA